MTDAPSTDDVRDIWVDYHLNPLPKREGIALVPEYQKAFDAWLETIRADERGKWLAYGDSAERDDMAVLRVKVQALADEAEDNRKYASVRINAYRAVLNLIDGKPEDNE